MYMRIINSLTAHVIGEGAADFIPDLFDYISLAGVEYQVVERLILLTHTEQGPFKEKHFAQIFSIFVEEKTQIESA